ncbi:MAG: alpha/beta hydrolase [Ferruginibacter sp.]|nr:alpha/beta hydrolase [Ferruginibacter sp.]
MTRRLLRCCWLFFFIYGGCLSSAAAQDSVEVISLWKNGAPGFENRKNEREQAKDWWVNTINNPSLSVYPAPKDIATGAAVVICPGGGFRNLVFNAEGRDAAKFLNNIGITAFVLKYRLFRQESSPYTQKHPTEDIFRAMRLVRSFAKQYAIDTARIGVMGFSAGGEVAGWVAYRYADKNFTNGDAIDQLTARPAFQILIYPGPLAVPDSVISTAPPTFLLAANDDECCSEPVIQLVQMHRKAKVPIEMHLLAQGNHGFNMGSRSNLNSIKTWPQRMADWLKDTGWLQKK